MASAFSSCTFSYILYHPYPLQEHLIILNDARSVAVVCSCDWYLSYRCYFLFLLYDDGWFNAEVGLEPNDYSPLESNPSIALSFCQ